jgi:hypothetical protein
MPVGFKTTVAGRDPHPLSTSQRPDRIAVVSSGPTVLGAGTDQGRDKRPIDLP